MMYISLFKFTNLKHICIYYKYVLNTVASRWFMRGTDPIKSTWVYPKFKL
jgi:hypothetical protein